MANTRPTIDIVETNSGNSAILRRGAVAIDLRKMQVTINERANNKLYWSQLTRAVGMASTVNGEPESWSRTSKIFVDELEAARGMPMTKEEKNIMQLGHPVRGLADAFIAHFRLGNGYEGLKHALREAEDNSFERGKSCASTKQKSNDAMEEAEMERVAKLAAEGIISDEVHTPDAIAQRYDVAAIRTKKQAGEVWASSIRNDLIPKARRLRPDLYGGMADDKAVWHALIEQVPNEACLIGDDNFLSHFGHVGKREVAEFRPTKQFSNYLCAHLGITGTKLGDFLNLVERASIHGLEKSKDGQRDIDALATAMQADRSIEPDATAQFDETPGATLQKEGLTFIRSGGKLHSKAHEEAAGVTFHQPGQGNAYDGILEVLSRARATKRETLGLRDQPEVNKWQNHADVSSTAGQVWDLGK